MRTVVSGLRALRRAPLAIAPLVIEGCAGAALVATGAFRVGSSSAAATAVFPLDIYFDVKQSLAYGSGWAFFVAAVALGIIVRSAVLSGTLWLTEGRPGSFLEAWTRAARLAACAALALFPAAALFFIGVATRYAPFVWLAAVAGLIPAVLFARRGVRLDVGGGEPEGRGVPEGPGFLSYAYVITAFGAVMTVLGRSSPLLAAVILLCLGPLHALYLLGWREHLRLGTYPGGGTLVVGVTVLLVGGLFFFATYDRYIRSAPPVARARRPGTLLELGGADSSTGSGALLNLDPRTLGFPRSRTTLLSYAGGDRPYTASDTRRDLQTIARIVAREVASAPPPRAWLGHSQAALVLDRILADRLPSPDAAVDLAPPPPYPPPIRVPPPGVSGEGAAGGDVARVFAHVLSAVGIHPYDIDAPASPTNLQRIAVAGGVPRVAVWALGDSVWLDGDWRRRDEVNVIALTDHVGIANDPSALGTAQRFFAGRPVTGDESSWRATLVSMFSYAFAPWRP